MRSYLSAAEIKDYYGIITGYAISLMLIPSFFAHAISTALLPSISESYSKKDYKQLHYLFRTSMILVFIPTGILCILLSFYSEEYMNLLFKTSNGANYVRYMAPFFIVFYFQAPIVSILHGLNRSKTVMINSLFTNVLKLVLIVVLCSQVSVNANGLPIAMIISSIILTLINYRVLSKIVKVKVSSITKLKIISVLAITAVFAYYLKVLDIVFIQSSIITFLVYILIIRITRLISIKKLLLTI